METKKDLKEYEDAWYSHIDTLNKLMWNLDEHEKNDLEEAQKLLKKLVKCASNDLAKRNKIKVEVLK